MYSDILYQVEDPLAIITLNRPDRLNAFTSRTLAEIRDAVERSASDTAVVGIVITGAGRGFCAGLDMAALEQTAAAGSSGRDESSSDEIPGLFTYLLAIEKPVIAAVNGVTAGGGFVLAAMCDLRFAAPEAAFTSVFSKRGLIAEHGTTWILPRLLGAGRALDLLWTSRKIDAAEAERIGLVEYLVPKGQDLLERVREYVVELAGNVSPGSHRIKKCPLVPNVGRIGVVVEDSYDLFLLAETCHTSSLSKKVVWDPPPLGSCIKAPRILDGKRSRKGS